MNARDSSRKFAPVKILSPARRAHDLLLLSICFATFHKMKGRPTMARKSKSAVPPSNTVAQWTVPPVLPDVATQPHPLGHAPEPPSAENVPEAGETQLQDVLPEIQQLAQKVGGLKKLARIVQTLDEMDK
jgi:hypothetical protein